MPPASHALPHPSSKSQHRPRLLPAATAIGIALATVPCSAGALDVSIQASLWLREGERTAYEALLGVNVDWESLLLPGQSRTGQHSAPRALDDSAWAESEAIDADDDDDEPRRRRVNDSDNEPSDEETVPVEEPSSPDEVQRPTAESRSKGRDAQSSSLLRIPPAWMSPAFAIELVQAVLSHHDMQTRDAHLLGMGSRSRTAALLPVLRLRAGRSTDQTLRFSPTVDDPDRWLQSGGADFRYEAQATWTLDRLIFADDEISLERLRLQFEKERSQRVAASLKLLFQWQRARLRELDESLLEEERIIARILRLQSEIELDVISGGWFSTRVARAVTP